MIKLSRAKKIRISERLELAIGISGLAGVFCMSTPALRPLSPVFFAIFFLAIESWSLWAFVTGFVRAKIYGFRDSPDIINRLFGLVIFLLLLPFTYFSIYGLFL